MSIYLDHAATSWPKPPQVARAAAEAIDAELGNAGRAVHAAARRSTAILEDCRKALADLLDEPDASRVVLADGCTYALNVAIHGTINAARRRGDPKPRIVTTQAEHNAVLRPLYTRSDMGEIDLRIAEVDRVGRVHREAVLEAMGDEPVLMLATQHASNVTGAVHPIAEIAGAVRERCAETIILIDAAQTAGLVPLHPRALGVDLVAIGGHKSLLGPPGIGALWVSERAEGCIESIVQGGTGDGRKRSMPDQLPRALESGTRNVPAAAGLLAALAEVRNGFDHDRLEHERALAGRLADRVGDIKGVRIVSDRQGVRTAVVSLVAPGMSAVELATVLDTSFNICAREGLHCAPLLHDAIGCPNGTLRLSVGWSTTEEDIEAAATALEDILAGAGV
jgi:cysteine desulfurase / selenocysteine lyase